MSVAQNRVRSNIVLESPQEEATLSIEGRQETAVSEWQERLLPTMTRMVVGLTIFFFVASLVQLAYLHWTISQSPGIAVGEALETLTPDLSATIDQALASSELKVMATLETYVLQRRYHQASVLLMASIWTRYLAFVTGMILALVGCSFILGKLQEPLSEVTGESPVGGISLKSSSPGLILAALGVALMMTTMIMQHDITVRDAPLYLQVTDSSAGIGETSSASDVETLGLPDYPEAENSDE
jgi:hypothetical protein